ncbi:sigma-70 family RNA polymerase sigma factor [Mumia sp. zg.B21]|uniref:sigma-70 family RNA polymerase sigma factor n=1 Tax=Mumia sp. zg.B21 TaxID=2855447 RepID=UPI001C6DFE20|nr:sigma-70 family RNA polymerase sigma factor [Mumia sp. zg.B21]MBW9211079.1 sigma-70 family RNA polymerase sigma factor [Mumia sp. zg.B21]
MTEPTADPSRPSDAELISAVRAGDNAAYGVLFERHRDAARRMAAQLVRSPDGDDLVSEAFIKVLDQLRAGAGPDVAFRAYLLTAIRRLHIDRVRADRRVQPSDDLEKYDGGVEFGDTAVASFESSAAAQAFVALPERWQLVLWHLDVEGAKPADIAPMLGMSANGVSALAYRAREGLRQSYLQVHLADTAEESCRGTTERLGAYVRQGLGKRETTKVREHLDGCARCTGVYLELVEVNSGLRGLLAPALLGAVGLRYVADLQGQVAAAGAGAGGSAAGGAGHTNPGRWAGNTAGRARDWVTAAPAHGVAAAGITLGVIGAAVVAAMAFMTLESPGGPTSDEVSDGPSLSLPGPTRPGDSDPRVRPQTVPPTAVIPPTLPGLVPPGSPSTIPGIPGVEDPGAPDAPEGPGAPDDPGPGGPGPDDPRNPEEPQPHDPGPNDPGPTEPAPTEPGPTEPTEPTEPAPTPPVAPRDLALTDEPGGLTLAWSAVAGADGYEVYRSVGTGLAGAGRSAAAVVSGDLVSGPDPLVTTSFVDTGAPNGARVVYEVVALNAAGRSETATLGPIRLPAVARISVRPIGLGTRCIEATGRPGSASTRLGSCGTATVWRVWDAGSGTGWWTIRAVSGPATGACLTSAARPVVSTVTTEACAGSTRQQWAFDPGSTASQHVSARARPGQVLDATTASAGGPLFTLPRTTSPRLDRNQRFSALLEDVAATFR